MNFHLLLSFIEIQSTDEVLTGRTFALHNSTLVISILLKLKTIPNDFSFTTRFIEIQTSGEVLTGCTFALYSSTLVDFINVSFSAS